MTTCCLFHCLRGWEGSVYCMEHARCCSVNVCPPHTHTHPYTCMHPYAHTYPHTHNTRSIARLLGEGYFSTVYEGTWRLPLRDVKVAVKKANDNLEEKEKAKFLQEASVIGQFNHPHIVKLYGVIMEDNSTGEPCVRCHRTTVEPLCSRHHWDPAVCPLQRGVPNSETLIVGPGICWQL